MPFEGPDREGALRVDAHLLRELVEDRADEADVVDLARAAVHTDAGIPAQRGPGPFGMHRDEAGSVGLLVLAEWAACCVPFDV